MNQTDRVIAAWFLLLSFHSAAQPPSSTQTSQAGWSEPVKLTFAKSPYADFLFYLFNRSTAEYPALAKTVSLNDIPLLQGSSFLPEDAIHSGVSSYDQLYQKVAFYDDRVRLIELLRKGEPRYSVFYSFWQQHIAPDEDKTARAWAQQAAAWPPVQHLEQMTRLRFPFSTLTVDMMALDPSGSSMQQPPTIFTGIQVPSLAWAIGHEGTHMILGPKGANWTKRKDSEQAIRLIKANGGTEYDVEEALCLLMQAQMSIAYGATPKSFRSSDKIASSPRRTLLRSLENNWSTYFKSSDSNAADFLIAETLRTFETLNGHQ